VHDMRNSAGPFAASLTTGLVLALLLWGGESTVARSPGWMTSWAALFFLLAILLPISILAALYFTVVAGTVNPYDRLADGISRWASYLTTMNAGKGWRLSNGIFWLSIYLAGATYGSYLLTSEIAVEIVRPRYQAILSLAATACCFLILLPLPRFGFALGRRLEGPAATAPGLRLLWSRPLHPVLALVTVAAAAATIFIVVFKDAILAAPWQIPTLLLAALLFAMALGGLITAAFSVRWITIVAGTVLIGLTLLSALAATQLASNDAKSRRYFQRVPATRLAYGLLTRLLDRDDDGFMHPFAGGDCAPDDSGISPISIDVPGNGIDEDCNGTDLIFAALARGRWDYPLPEDYPKKPLPVFLVTADALSANHVGFMGYKRDTTPNLDGLADQCVVFEKAFAQGPSTRLSVAAMLTGLHDTQIERGEGRKVPYPLLPENETLPEIFRDNGYDTVFVSPNRYFHSRWKGILQGFGAIEKKAASKRMKGVSHNAKKMTDEALKHLRRKHSKPLFMWVHYYDMHPPFGQPAGIKSFGKRREDLYDAEVRYWDSEVTRLFEAIHKKHKRTGYILIVSADHGSAFDKNHKKHSHGYDLHSAVLHVPLLICSGEMPPRRVEKTAVGLLDIAPTLVNLNGLKSDVEYAGTSLVPLLFGGLEWPDRVLFHQFYLAEKIRKGQDPLYGAAARNGRYNYMWDRREDEYLLFDYAEDPDEEINLMEERTAIAENMDTMLKTWLYRVRNNYMKGHFESNPSFDEGGPYGYDAVYH
jgi:arylsulfatase A-like enzyme